MKRNRFDKELKETGKWFTFGEGTVDECELKIASMGNTKFMTAYGEWLNSEDKEPSKLADIMAEYILVDWKGYEEDDGTPIEYSVEEAVNLLNDDNGVLNFVSATMQSEDAYRREIVAKKAKK